MRVILLSLVLISSLKNSKLIVGQSSVSDKIFSLKFLRKPRHVDRIPPAVVVDVPNVTTSEYRVIGIDEDGYLSVVDSKGQSDQVLTLPAGELRDEISDIFGKNENTTIYVSVILVEISHKSWIFGMKLCFTEIM